MFPNNIAMAQSLRNSLKKRLIRDSSFKERYVNQMEVMIEKKYAEKLPKKEKDHNQKIWYITHHGVKNPQKPKNALVKGPDLANSLVAVLLRFRKDSIALVADIESMIYQVKASSRDRDSL